MSVLTTTAIVKISVSIQSEVTTAHVLIQSLASHQTDSTVLVSSANILQAQKGKSHYSLQYITISVRSENYVVHRAICWHFCSNILCYEFSKIASNLVLTQALSYVILCYLMLSYLRCCRSYQAVIFWLSVLYIFNSRGSGS